MKNGGAHGVASIVYANRLSRIEGREIKSVSLDPERAPHIKRALETYARGQVGISDLRDLLEERGLRSRKTTRYVGSALSNAQAHRLLSNPYYTGCIKHRDVFYDGAHEPLISDETWNEVQSVLAGRRIAGDRSWKHSHFLKGTVKCNRCKRRMGFGYANGRGGTYAYFFCLNRHTGRSVCDLPYIQQHEVENAVDHLWASQHYSEAELAHIEETIDELVALELNDSRELVAVQQSRLVTLTRKKRRLSDAYLDGIVQPEDLKPRQEQLQTEIADAERLVRNAAVHGDITKERIGILLKLARKAHKLHRSIGDRAKGDLNRAQFRAIYIDSESDEPGQGHEVTLVPAHADVLAAFVAVAQEARQALNARDKARRRRTSQPTAEDNGKTPDKLSLAGGSNLYLLAVTVGFEPTLAVTPNNISSVAPSAARTRHQTTPLLYRKRPVPPKPGG